jgi:flagellin
MEGRVDLLTDVGDRARVNTEVHNMRINQNVMAFNAYRNLSTTQGQMGKSLEKLSSGFRINRAADDAAGLVISENLRSGVRGLDQAIRNAQDGVSVVQTAEGGLTEVHEMLQRVRELGVQASNTGVNDATALQAIQDEVTELIAEIDRVASDTQFAEKNLLDGTYDAEVFQVGANDGQTIEISIDNMDAATLGVDGLDFTANVDLTVIDAAIESVSETRAQLGATQNRFEHTIANLSVTVENLQASESRIRDTDMAQEMVSFTRHQILQQAGTAMLAQANQVPQSVLNLLA